MKHQLSPYSGVHHLQDGYQYHSGKGERGEIVSLTPAMGGRSRAKKGVIFAAICLAISILLTACAFPKADTGDLATEVAANIYATQTAHDILATEVASDIYATQTAQAPPPAPTFTATPSATPTPPPSPTPTITPTSTHSPTPTWTPTFTPTPTSTPTPTPVPDAVVKAKVGNLRAGPGTNYRVIGKVSQGQEVDILSKSPGGNWVKVSITKGDNKVIGWLWVKLLIIYTPLKTVVVEANIPPTPTPKPTPLPRVCRPDAALIQVVNHLEVALTLELRGPEAVRFTVPANDHKNYCFAPGEYSYTAWASGYTTDNDSKTFEYEPGDCNCWDFYYLIIPLFGCSCSENPADYVPPPLIGQ